MPAPVAARHPGLIDRAIARGITLYQRYISPCKGFRCAHRALHRGDSCSQCVKAVVLRFGVVRGAALARRRFHACRTAAATLRKKRRAEPEYESLPPKPRDHRRPCDDRPRPCSHAGEDACLYIGPCPCW